MPIRWPVRVRLYVLIALFQPRDAEVQQLGRAVRLHKDVGRLYVAMDDVVAMRIAERRADLFEDAQPVGQRKLRVQSESACPAARPATHSITM